MLKILQKTLTHIWWFGNFLTMNFDFLGYRGFQGTHMDPLKPSGIFWTKFVDLTHSAQWTPCCLDASVWHGRTALQIQLAASALKICTHTTMVEITKILSKKYYAFVVPRVTPLKPFCWKIRKKNPHFWAKVYNFAFFS